MWESDLSEKSLKVAVIRGTNLAGERFVYVKRPNFRETRKHVIPKRRLGKELVNQSLHQRSLRFQRDNMGEATLTRAAGGAHLEDVAQRYPVQELEQSLKRADQERLLDRVGHDVFTQLQKGKRGLVVWGGNT